MNMSEQDVDMYLVGKLQQFGYKPEAGRGETISFPGALGEAVYGPRRQLIEEGRRRLQEQEGIRTTPRAPGFNR